MTDINIDDLRTTRNVIKPLTPQEQVKDEIGYTNLNLHRRIDPQQPEDPREALPRSYSMGVYDGINSYRTTTIYYHDEESTTCEIP